MKSIIRFVVLALMLSGWILAALCVHVVRTPNPADATQSKWVVIPKSRIGLAQTYVDARSWSLADVAANSSLVSRLVEAGKADQLQFLANPKVKEDIQSQLTDALAGKLTFTQTTQPATTNKSPMRLGKI